MLGAKFSREEFLLVGLRVHLTAGTVLAAIHHGVSSSFDSSGGRENSVQLD